MKLPDVSFLETLTNVHLALSTTRVRSYENDYYLFVFFDSE